MAVPAIVMPAASIPSVMVAAAAVVHMSVAVPVPVSALHLNEGIVLRRHRRYSQPGGSGHIHCNHRYRQRQTNQQNAFHELFSPDRRMAMLGTISRSSICSLPRPRSCGVQRIVAFSNSCRLNLPAGRSSVASGGVAITGKEWQSVLCCLSGSLHGGNRMAASDIARIAFARAWSVYLLTHSSVDENDERRATLERFIRQRCEAGANDSELLVVDGLKYLKKLDASGGSSLE